MGAVGARLELPTRGLGADLRRRHGLLRPLGLFGDATPAGFAGQRHPRGEGGRRRVRVAELLPPGNVVGQGLGVVALRGCGPCSGQRGADDPHRRVLGRVARRALVQARPAIRRLADRPDGLGLRRCRRGRLLSVRGPLGRGALRSRGARDHYAHRLALFDDALRLRLRRDRRDDHEVARPRADAALDALRGGLSPGVGSVGGDPVLPARRPRRHLRRPLRLGERGGAQA
mmetsp:Transcript_92705/g.267706  ORF Transcript_92705/g.267706 Transcript_92705/m.267706 type:complete len:230 (+) Transcript_92705:937-1626(+)